MGNYRDQPTRRKRGRTERLEKLVTDWQELDAEIHGRARSAIGEWRPGWAALDTHVEPATRRRVARLLEVLPAGSPMGVLWTLGIGILIVGALVVYRFLVELGVLGMIFLIGVMAAFMFVVEFSMIVWVGVAGLLFLGYVFVTGYPFVALFGLVMMAIAAAVAYYQIEFGDGPQLPDQTITPSKQTIVSGAPALVLAVCFVTGSVVTALVVLGGLLSAPQMLLLWVGVPAIGGYFAGGYLREQAAAGSAWTGRFLEPIQALRESHVAQEAVRIAGRSSWTLFASILAWSVIGVVFLVVVALLYNSPVGMLFWSTGLLIAYFGYAIHEEIIKLAGALVGGLSGLFLGGVLVANELATDPGPWFRVVAALIAAYALAKLGGYLTVFLHHLAIYISGFLAAAVPTFVILAGVRSLQRLQSVMLADFTGPVVVAIVVGLLGAVLLMTVYKAAIVVLTSFLGAILVWGGFTITLDGGHMTVLFIGPLVFVTGGLFQWLVATAETKP